VGQDGLEDSGPCLLAPLCGVVVVMRFKKNSRKVGVRGDWIEKCGETKEISEIFPARPSAASEVKVFRIPI
jgi:hypothetical protein